MKLILINKSLSTRLKSLFRFHSKGFTLIELSIVLIVIGLVVAIGMPLVGVLSKRVKFNESRDTINAAIESVSSWAAGNNRLPDLSGTGSPTDFRNAAKNPVDAFGNSLIYIFDNNATTNICGRKIGAITLVTDTGSTIQNVAYIVLGRGDDYTVESTLNGTLNGSAVNGAIPTTGPGGYATGTINADTGNDIVKWVTIDELRTKTGCQGAQMKIVNNELPYGYNGTPYTANIYADGGVPFSSGGKYRWCVQNSTGVVFANMTFKDTGGTNNIPFSTNCQGLAETSWMQSDNIVIGGVPALTVTGTDSKVYTCIASHIAASANQPVTGAGYAAYWQLGGSIGSTWTSGNSYPSGSNTMTIFVRDNNDPSGSNDNVSQKNFVLTINPS